MKKTIVILAIFVVALFITGCIPQKSPDIVCNSPYMRHGAGCCMDKNSNKVCDTDEEEDPLFVEPDYAPEEEKGSSAVMEDMPVYVPPSEEDEEEDIETDEAAGEEVIITPQPKVAYTAPEPELAGWTAETAYMSMEVTKIVIDVVPVEPKDLKSPDKEAYLKEIYLTVKNKGYSYITPRLTLRMGDSKDPIIISEALLCDRSDDIVMEGCSHALPEAESMQIRMQMDRKIPRLDLDKTVVLTLENRRDNEDDNILKIEKTKDILDIFGVTYI